MTRLRVGSAIAAFFLTATPSAGLTAETDIFDGVWTVRIEARGGDRRVCRLRDLKGYVTISGGKVRVNLRQNGMVREFFGGVDRYGYIDAAGDWERRRGSQNVLQTHFLNGRIRKGRFLGAFYSFALLGGKSCFARFVIAGRRPLPWRIAGAEDSPAPWAAGSPEGLPDAPAGETDREAGGTAAAPELTGAWDPVDAVEEEADAAADDAGAPQGSPDAWDEPVALGPATEAQAPAPAAADAVDGEADGPAAGDPASPESRIETARRMVAAGPITEAIAYVNGPGDLSPIEQWTLFGELDGPDIVERLTTSDDATARKIGRILETVTNGGEVSQPRMKAELAALGVDDRVMLTYLVLFERARKFARTVMYGGALAELRRAPRVADVAVRAAAEHPSAGGGAGRRVALLIGVERYRRPIPDLGTPAADVEAVGRELRRRFGYETRILKNAPKAEIIAALQDLVDTLGERDSAIIMYAGHGYLVEATGLGYWLPADAATNSAKQWMSNGDVTKFLEAIRARHVMLIADSCYSGSLLSGEDGGDGVGIAPAGEDLDDGRSVVIMTSGGEEPVRDDGGAGHSLFARQLMTTLAAVERERPGADVYTAVRTRIARLAPQVPRYGGVASAGHQAGADHVFRAVAGAAAVAADGPSSPAAESPPAAATAAHRSLFEPEPAPLAAPREVVVKPGDSLWRIARRAYGRGARNMRIFEANRDSIRDPDLIYPGQRLTLPRLAAAGPGTSARPGVTRRDGASPPPAARSGRVVVRPGDSLWRIARRVYGRGTRNMDIFRVNRDRIRVPDLIYPRQDLALPGNAAPRRPQTWSSSAASP